MGRLNWIGKAVMVAALATPSLFADRIDHDRADVARDYRRVEAMRADIARDEARLDEDIRCGRRAAAARDRSDLARDQRALAAQMRDIRHDRRWDRDWR